MVQHAGVGAVFAQHGPSSTTSPENGALENSFSVDCTTAINPLFPQPQNQNLASRLGYGMVVKEYGAGREANSEFFAKIRGMLDGEKIRWQTHSYDAGYGGGTIAAWFAGQNMDVIDVGIGILSMHSPYDVSSKVDLWHLRRGFEAFFKQN